MWLKLFRLGPKCNKFSVQNVTTIQVGPMCNDLLPVKTWRFTSLKKKIQDGRHTFKVPQLKQTRSYRTGSYIKKLMLGRVLIYLQCTVQSFFVFFTLTCSTLRISAPFTFKIHRNSSIQHSIVETYAGDRLPLSPIHVAYIYQNKLRQRQSHGPSAMAIYLNWMLRWHAAM